jgi:hypothetical protein
MFRPSVVWGLVVIVSALSANLLLADQGRRRAIFRATTIAPSYG